MPAPAAARVLTAPADGAVVAASAVHGAAVVALHALAASAPAPAVRAATVLLLALGMCWGSNTVSHIHLHGPLFRRERANRAFSLYLGVLLSVPQRWWKLRHLAHHGQGRGERLGAAGALEVLAVAGSWAALLTAAPALFLSVTLPAWLVGLALCALQGHYEHAGGAFGVDHHGRLYNRLWFNDGFHVAHHRDPGAHWTALAAFPRQAADARSPFPPLLRWCASARALANRVQGAALDALERAALVVPGGRALLLATHRRAWRALLAELPAASVGRAVIVGGGLFPRTALLLAELLPAAELVLLDAAPAHLARARRELARRGRLERVSCMPVQHAPGAAAPCDLLVIPLAYRGDRDALYRHPPARAVAIHDWIWRRRGSAGWRVSWLLGKRLNLVRAC
jgi:hypothetical protein